MWMDVWGWAQVRSFNCDMYWPLLNMYWESSGFGRVGGGVILGAGETLINRGGD